MKRDPEFTRDAATAGQTDAELIAAALRQESGGHAASSANLRLPGRIGPYRIIRQIGTGGMGVVYEAEQELPIRRRVALKVIKLGMDTRAFVRRFEAERQALALMDHPNIARVYDAGATEAGRPYFAMEYVPGLRITEYCDQFGLTVTERLELFAQVCHAVQHAHQKGIIHRDLKPSNVLVMEQEGGTAASGRQVVPKVIDFGVAKAVDAHGAAGTLLTEQGRLVGTPVYMSPEQAGLTVGDVDTRTDIYSLGILLYELLVGGLPYSDTHLRRRSVGDVQQIVRTQEPIKPSTRIGSRAGGASEFAATRGAAPRTLRRQLRGDLDWITLKALEKDRDRRYASAAELAADVRHYLRHEPVMAGPPGTVYRVRKFVRRNRGLVASAAVVLTVLAGGTIASTTFGVRAVRAAREAQRRAYRGSIAGANAALAVNQTGTARRYLDEAPVEYRNWEWRYLDAAADQSLWTLPHAADVWSVAFSPDGRRLVSGAEDGQVYLWDVGTRRLERTLRGHSDCVYSVTFSPDGSLVASGSRDGTVRIWDAQSGAGRSVLNVGATVLSVAFSADGRRLVSASNADEAVRIWDPVTGTEVSAPLQHDRPVFTVAIHPKRDQIATGTYGGMIYLWDLSAGRPARWVVQAHSAFVRSLAFSPDGKHLASGAKDGKLVLWDAQADAPALGDSALLSGGKGVVQCVAFSPDSAYLASGGDETTIRLWSVASHEEVALLRGHGGIVQGLAFSPDGRLLASACRWDRTVRLWDTGIRTCRSVLTHPERPGLVMFSADGRFVRCATAAGIYTWNTFTGAQRSAAARTPGTNTLALCQDLARYAVRLEGEGNVIGVGDAASGELLQRLSGHTARVHGLSFSADGNRLASGANDGTVRIWDLSTGQELRVLRMRALDVRSVVLSPDGRRVAVVEEDSGPAHTWVFSVWDTLSGRELCTRRETGNSASGLSFRPDGTQAAFGQSDGSIHIWDLESGSDARVLHGHTDRVTWVAYNPDGSRLASASEDRSIRIWDPVNGEELLMIQGHEDLAQGVVFSPDGSLLASWADDKTVRIWDGVPYRDRYARGTAGTTNAQRAPMKSAQRDAAPPRQPE